MRILKNVIGCFPGQSVQDSERSRPPINRQTTNTVEHIVPQRRNSAATQAKQLPRLPFDVLVKVADHVSPADAFAMSHASSALKDAAADKAFFHLCTRLDTVTGSQHTELLATLMASVRKHARSAQASAFIKPLALHFTATTLECPCDELFNIAVNTRIEDRTASIRYIDLSWFPLQERISRMDELVDAAKAVQEAGLVPTHAQLFRVEEVHNINGPEFIDFAIEVNEQAMDKLTPQWIVKSQIEKLPPLVQLMWHDATADLDSEPFQKTVARMMPRNRQGPGVESIRYAQALQRNVGFDNHEASFLAGTTDFETLQRSAANITALVYRMKNNLHTLDSWVESLEKGNPFTPTTWQYM